MAQCSTPSPEKLELGTIPCENTSKTHQKALTLILISLSSAAINNVQLQPFTGCVDFRYGSLLKEGVSRKSKKEDKIIHQVRVNPAVLSLNSENNDKLRRLRLFRKYCVDTRRGESHVFVCSQILNTDLLNTLTSPAEREKQRSYPL